MTKFTDPATFEAIEERTRAVAYRLWEEDGRPDGRNQDHWDRAAEIVTTEMARARARDVADPGWLQRDAPPAKAKIEPDIGTTLEQLSKRIAGKSAAA